MSQTLGHGSQQMPSDGQSALSLNTDSALFADHIGTGVVQLDPWSVMVAT